MSSDPTTQTAIGICGYRPHRGSWMWAPDLIDDLIDFVIPDRIHLEQIRREDSAEADFLLLGIDPQDYAPPAYTWGLRTGLGKEKDDGISRGRFTGVSIHDLPMWPSDLLTLPNFEPVVFGGPVLVFRHLV
jgi:hypothetical protein